VPGGIVSLGTTTTLSCAIGYVPDFPKIPVGSTILCTRSQQCNAMADTRFCRG